MLKWLVVLMVLLGGSTTALADAKEDCNKKSGDVAIAGCTELIRQNPRNAGAYYNRGIEYRDKRDYDRAIADYSKAVELNPKFADAYHNRGNGYKAKGDNDRAIADYTKAIGLDPKDARAYYNRGLVYGVYGGDDRAIADFNKTIEFAPKFANAYYNRGRIHFLKSDYGRAIADQSKAIEIDPKLDEAYGLRGVAYVEIGELDRAIADFTKAIEIDPKDAYHYGGRGNAYSHKGDNDRAIGDYTKARDLNPKHFSRGLGLVRYNKGDFKGAAADLLRAIELNDDIYAMLFRYLARSRLGESAAAELEANASRLKTKEWPYAVAELYLGKRSTGATLDAATQPFNCAQSYIGQWHILNGNAAQAASSLKAAVDTCPTTSGLELQAAVAELKRLKP